MRKKVEWNCKLPKDLAEVLNYTDADACNQSIAAIEKAFQTAVEKRRRKPVYGL